MMHLGFIEKIFTAPAVVVHPEDVQERRLPSARWTHDRNEVAFLDIQIDHSQHRSGLRSERHPNADLTRAAGHRISFDSVETHYGQTKRKSAEDGKQSRARANKPKIKIRIEMLSEGSQRKNWD